jgi:hypothetical protein
VTRSSSSRAQHGTSEIDRTKPSRRDLQRSQSARVAFKGWPHGLRKRFLQGLLAEHAYLCGLMKRPFDVKGVSQGSYAFDLVAGRSHRARHQRMLCKGDRT